MIDIKWLETFQFKKSESDKSMYRKRIKDSCDVVVKLNTYPYCYLERGDERIELDNQPITFNKFEDIVTTPAVGLFCKNIKIGEYIALLKQFHIECHIATKQ